MYRRLAAVLHTRSGRSYRNHAPQTGERECSERAARGCQLGTRVETADGALVHGQAGESDGIPVQSASWKLAGEAMSRNAIPIAARTCRSGAESTRPTRVPIAPPDTESGS